MIPFINKQKESYANTKTWYIWKTKFEHRYTNDENYHKFKDHCHYTGKNRGAAHSICSLKYNMPTKILVVFHNGLNYGYQSIIKELANKF